MGKSGVVVLAAGAVLGALLPAVAVAAPSEGEDAASPVAEVTGSSEASRVARGIVVKTRASDVTVQRAVQRSVGSSVDVQAPDQLSGAVSVVDFDAVVPLEEAAAAAAEVAQRADVEWAVPNARRTASAASPVPVNDPLFGKQHGLWDAKASSAGGYSLKAPAAWRSTTGEGAVVAVLDTGIRSGHPDVRGRLVPGYDMIGADQDQFEDPLQPGDPFEFYTANDGDGRDADPSDPGDWIPKGDEYCYGERTPELEPSSWHGTHVAGIVAAQQNNKTGISGVAPDARVQPVRVLGRCGGWDSDIYAGMIWASGGAVPGVPANPTPADVMNLSLGGNLDGVPDAEAVREEYCVAYGDIAAAALERGTVTVAAAGNELGKADLSIPASCPDVISVAATSRKGRAAFYTNRGASVDIAAPGGDFVVDGDGNGILSTVDLGLTRPSKSGYAEYMGTSMAAPGVAGGAALLMAAGVPAKQVETALKGSVGRFAPTSTSTAVTRYPIRMPDGSTKRVNLNCTSTCGVGILDLNRAALPTTPPRVTGAPVVGETLAASPGTWVSGTTAVTYQWLRDGAPISGATGSTYDVVELDRGARLSVVTSPTRAGFQQVRSTSSSKKVGTAVAVVPEQSQSTTTYGRTFRVSAVVRDDVEGKPDRTVTFTSGSTVLGTGTTDADGRVSVTVGATALAAGRRTIEASTTDGSDALVSDSFTVTVAKARSSIAQSIASKVSRQKRAALTVTVKVSGVPSPTGQLRVYDGKKRIATVNLSSTGRGKRVVSLPKLAKGKHTIKTVYVGTGNIIGKTSSTRTVTSK